MSRGTPSLVALLGLLAVAGYKNRDRMKDLLGQGAVPGASQGALGNLGGLLRGVGAGGLLSGGIGELVQRFTGSGHGSTAESWVGKGPNQPLAPSQLEQAIGPDVLNSLTQHTGLSREELLSRLTRELPEAVDSLTPEGRVPTEDEAARLLQERS